MHSALASSAAPARPRELTGRCAWSTSTATRSTRPRGGDHERTSDLPHHRATAARLRHGQAPAPVNAASDRIAACVHLLGWCPTMAQGHRLSVLARRIESKSPRARSTARSPRAEYCRCRPSGGEAPPAWRAVSCGALRRHLRERVVEGARRPRKETDAPAGGRPRRAGVPAATMKPSARTQRCRLVGTDVGICHARSHPDETANPSEGMRKCGAFPAVLPTSHKVHKALNLARLPIPPQALEAAAPFFAGLLRGGRRRSERERWLSDQRSR